MSWHALVGSIFETKLAQRIRAKQSSSQGNQAFGRQSFKALSDLRRQRTEFLFQEFVDSSKSALFERCHIHCLYSFVMLRRHQPLEFALLLRIQRQVSLHAFAEQEPLLLRQGCFREAPQGLSA